VFNSLAELQEPYLFYTNIGPDGAAALAGGFKFLTALQKLDLSDNNIGCDGAVVMVPLL